MEKYQRLLLGTCISFLLFFLPVSTFAADKVTLQLIWKNQFQFAGYYVAKELGFYADAGLDVSIKEYEFGTDVTAEVVSQRAHFGVSRSSLILERMEGEPVFLLSAIFQHSPFMLLAKNREDLRDVADLKGKRIMVTDDVVAMASLTAMLVTNGIKPDDYTPQKHTFSVDDLISGNTDAIAAYISNEPYQMEKRGVDYTIFSPKDHGFDFYSDILFTSQELYKDNPQLVERFHQASLRGWDYAFSHINEAVAIILEKYNTQNRNKDALLFEANSLKKLAYDRDISLGLITKDRVERIAQVYQLLGFTNKPLKTDGLIYSPKDMVRLKLTPEEQAWLKKHPVIRVHNEWNWPPFNYNIDGEPTGLSIDYMNLLASRIGIKVKYISGEWGELLDQAFNKKLDVMLNIVKTPERQKYLLYTDSYAKNPNVIITREESSISDTQSLFGKKVAYPEGFFYDEVLKTTFPEIIRVPMKDTLGTLKAIQFGKIDAALGELAVANYLIRENLLTGLAIKGSFESGNPEIEKLNIAVRNDWPILATILDKALLSITLEEHRLLRQRWLESSKTSETTVILTPEEKAWVSNLTMPLKVANEMDWPPFDFAVEGEPKGFSIDLVKMVADKVGIEIEFVNGFTWAELLEKFNAGEIDIMPAIYKTPQRQEIISFTSSYMTNPSVLVVNEKTKGIGDLTDLEGKNVAVVDGFSLNQIMKDRHPGIKQQEVANVLEGLKSVSLGKADAFIGSLGIISYILDKNFVPGIKITKEIWLEEPDEATLYMGVSKENIILRDILEKGLSAISSKELNDIRQRWMSRTVDEQKFDMASILSDKEIKWLSKHQIFKLGIDQAWPPFEFLDSEGNYSGIGSSYVKAVEERLDITMKPLQGLSWPQVISKAQTGEVNILPAVVRTEAGEKYLNFTKPYISLPIIIASRKDAPYIDGLSDLAGLKVGVAKDYTIIDLLEQDSSNLYLVLHGTLAKGLEELNAGRTDVFIDNLGSITYEMDRKNLTNIKIAAPTKYNLDISMGVRKDWPEMVDILNKTIDSMSDQEHAVIKNTWMALEVKFGFDLKAMLIWIIPIAGSVVLVIFFVLVWNRRLSFEVTERKEKEKLIKLGAQISQSLTVVDTLKETLQSITDIFVKDLNVAFARIWIVDETDNVLVLQASSGLYTHIEGAHERVPIGGDTKIGRVVAEQHPQMSNSIQESPYVEDKEWAREQGLTSFAGIPMIVEGRSVGALVLFSHEPIQEDTRPTILSIADSIAVAIERNHAEETALASERKIRAMSESSLDALIMIDGKANIIFWNPAAERIFGYNAEEVMGRNLHELIVPAEERELASKGMAEFVQTGEGMVIGVVIEHQGLRKDGSVFPAEIAVSALQMENEWYAVGTVRDISDRKQAEEELQQHLQDLKQFERLAVGREERMIDLKAQINDLLQDMGQAKKYKIV